MFRSEFFSTSKGEIVSRLRKVSHPKVLFLNLGGATFNVKAVEGSRGKQCRMKRGQS